MEELPMDNPIEDYKIVYEMGYDAHKKKAVKLLGEYRDIFKKRMKGWCKYTLHETTNHLKSIITTARGKKKEYLLKRYDKQEELSKKFLKGFRGKFLIEYDKLVGDINE